MLFRSEYPRVGDDKSPCILENHRRLSQSDHFKLSLKSELTDGSVFWLVIDVQAGGLTTP